MRLTWRLFGWANVLSLALASVELSGAESPFDFSALQARARTLASKPYVAAPSGVPNWLANLTYDQLRRIEFGGSESLWLPERLPFQVQYLHPGFIHRQVVQLAEVRDGRARPIPFRREYFNYQDVKLGAFPPTMGFAGFRLMYPLESANGRHSEIGSFLGASYFRFLAQGGTFGLSARGLALDTAEPTGEEFPTFTDFWLERPAPEAKSATLYALLNSPSVAGAYRFEIVPGRDTVVRVKATVYARKNAKVFGIAPLTSMFWRGENSNARTEDFRPEIHDSDGLLVHNGAGEWIWRPLVNPRGVRVTSFSDENPRAFGLFQRDRNFESYQDLEAYYHLRPSAWIEPVGRWGRGDVRLVELPTKDEYNDNIVAFWVPERLPAPGQPIEIEYRLHWVLDGIRPPAGVAVATRHGKSVEKRPDLERFIVDFDGPPLRSLGPEAKLEPVLSVGPGAQLVHSTLQKNVFNGSWRVAFTLKPERGARSIELRCFLRQGPDALTETWSYLWQP